MVVKARDIKEVLVDGKVEFFSELDKVDKETLVGRVIVIEAIKIFQDWDSEYGTNDFALVKIMNEKGVSATTLFSGKVVLKQLRRLAGIRNALPVRCLVNRVMGRNQREYFIFDSAEPNEGEN